MAKAAGSTRRQRTAVVEGVGRINSRLRISHDQVYFAGGSNYGRTEKEAKEDYEAIAAYKIGKTKELRQKEKNLIAEFATGDIVPNEMYRFSDPTLGKVEVRISGYPLKRNKDGSFKNHDITYLKSSATGTLENEFSAPSFGSKERFRSLDAAKRYAAKRLIMEYESRLQK